MKERRVEDGEAKRRWTGPTAYLGGITWRYSYSPYSRGFLVRLIVPSFTYILLLSHDTAGQIHFVFIKFHKASRQTTQLYFPFSRLGRHSTEEECRGKWRTRGDDYVRLLSRCLSFFLHRSLILRLSFSPIIFLFTCTSVHADLSLSLSFVACIAAWVRCHHPVDLFYI